MSFALHSLEGHRATLTRIKDVRFAHGWIQMVESTGLFIQAPLEFSVAPGDWFLMEALIPNHRVRMKVALQSVGEVVAHPDEVHSLTDDRALRDRSFQFRFEGPPELGTSEEKARCMAQFEPVAIEELPKTKAYLLDRGLHGVGLYCDSPLEPFAKYRLSFRLGDNTFRLGAEVRYCRAMGDHNKLFRVGLAITDMHRLDAPRWQALLSSPLYSS